VPAQYDAAKPACVTIFQAGGGFISDTGAWRAPIVFDNLIYKRVLRRQGHLPWEPVKLPRPQL
jgi:hypothetical protein